LSEEHAGDRDEALARLADDVARSLAAGEDPDPAHLATEHGVTEEDVTDCVASLRAVDEAMFAALDLDADDLPTPDLPDDFEILEEIGRGGMGVVYRVRQRSLDRVVAVKVIRPAAHGFAETVRRFRKEARSLAKLRHPGLVAVHEVGVAGDAVFFSMDLVEGRSLAARVAEGRLTPTETLRVMRRVASAVCHCHERGIIHRDLKPANVLLDEDGEAWVVDFGLARDVALSMDATGTGRLLGTPAYMSPEQARGDGQPVGEAADVYALGALLYECLTGRAPFAGKPLPELIRAVLEDDPVRPGRIDPSIPRDLETIVMTAMAKRPERRYATCLALLADLEAFAEGGHIKARRPGAWRRAGQFLVRHREPFSGALVTAALFTIVVFAWVLPRIGRTPETLADLAGDFLERKEGGAALALCDEALTRLGDGDTDLHHGLRLARLESLSLVAEGIFESGRVEDAESILDRVVQENDAFRNREDWAGIGRPLWLRARIAAARSDREAFRKAISDLHSEVMNTHRDAEHGPERVFERPAEKVLDLVTERALEKDGVDRALTWGLLDLATMAAPVPVRWFAEDLATRRPVLEEVLRVAAEASAQRVLSHRDFHPVCTLIIGLSSLGHEDEVMAFLAAVARDSDALDEERALALYLLAEILDLPRDPRKDPYRNFAAWTEARAAATLGLLNDLSRETRAEILWRRIDVAVDLGDRQWLVAHIGGEWGSEGSWRRWWATHLSEEPAVILARRAGIPNGTDLTDRVALLDLLRTASSHRRTLIHQLLVLAAPPDVRCPNRRRRPRDDLVRAWRDALGLRSDPRPYRLRTAMVILEDADPPRIVARQVRRIGIGDSVNFELGHTEPRRWETGFGVPGLGALAREPRSSRSRSTGSIELDWRGGALRIDRVHVGTILVRDSMNGHGGGRHRPVRTRFLIHLAEEDTGDPRAYSLEDWRRILAANLRELSRGLREEEPEPVRPRSTFQRARHHAIWTLPRLAAKLGLPGHADLVADFPWDRADMLERRDPSRARLAAGDAGILDDPLLAADLRECGGDWDSPTTAGWWGRLLLTTEEPRIRNLAASVLAEKGMPDRVAAAIERAVDTGDLEIPETLRTKIDGAGWRALRAEGGLEWGWLAFTAVAWILALLAAGFAFWPGRRIEARGRAAVQLLMLGLCMAAFDVRLLGFDLLPDTVGLLLAAAGAALLVRGSGARSLVPVALLVAAVAAGLKALGVAPVPTGALADAFAATALILLPALVQLVDVTPDLRVARLPDRRSARRWSLAAFELRVPFVLAVGASLFWLADLSQNNTAWYSVSIPMIPIWIVAVLAWFASRQSRRLRRGEPLLGLSSHVLYALFLGLPALLWTVGATMAFITGSDPRDGLSSGFRAVVATLAVLAILRMGMAMGLAARRRAANHPLSAVS
jgi:predicted Ser/Thr protein kinase